MLKHINSASALTAAVFLFTCGLSNAETTGATATSGGTSSNAGAGLTLSSSLSSPNLTSSNMPSVTADAANSNSAENNAAQETVTGIDESLVPSQFQTFIANSTGIKLEMYGYKFFNKAPSTFAPLTGTSVPADYVIGAGDELVVQIWGQVEATASVIVDRGGMINLPKVGPVSVVGVRYQDLQSHLKSAIGRIYRNFELDVSLGRLKALQIYVVGHARKPGSYTIGSLSTLVNALIASGGPSSNGSIRNIQLKRGGKVISDFDMYDLLLKGDKSKDVQLISGDVIYIPPVGPMAAITGSVGTPAIYELKGKESLKDLLQLAGGLTNTASGKTVAIERIQDRSARKVDEFELNETGLAKQIQDADLVTVYSVSARFDNAITLRGNLAIPGRHPWKEGMRISDIIQDKESLITDGYWLKQNQSASVDVASSNGLRNEVKRSAEEINWDYAVVERMNPADLTTNLIPFNLGKAVIEHDPTQNLILKAGDIITVFSKTDIGVSIASKTAYVRLEGEFNSPGVYQVQPGETLRTLVARIGGVTSHSYMFASEFTRESTRKIQQQRLDELILQMEQDIQRNSAQSATTALSQQDVAAAQSTSKAQQAMLTKMKAIKATGRVVFEIPEDSVSQDDLPDLALEDGDVLRIPPKPSTIVVIGNVYNQSAFIFKDGMNVNDYLKKSGGPTSNGNEDEVYLIRADGTVFSKKQEGWLNSFSGKDALPGDTIIVPEQLEKYSFTKDLKDWTQIFYQFALGAAGGKAAKMW
ncbi:MAG: SLBB domain-containing protein [Gallionella sp.]|nr:SLBB domain-containing protein [Gallionella sp.]